MASKADFYLGRGLKAKWIGSITYGGYTPSENGRTLIINVCNANTEEKYREAVLALINYEHSEGFNPENGWPWDYPDSSGTDYSYYFAYHTVKCSCYGSVLFDPFKENKWEEGVFLKLPQMTVKPKLEPAIELISEIVVGTDIFFKKKNRKK